MKTTPLTDVARLADYESVGRPEFPSQSRNQRHGCTSGVQIAAQSTVLVKPHPLARLGSAEHAIARRKLNVSGDGTRS